MPNRIIRDRALSSKKLASTSAEGERLYWRLLMVADDFGRFDADPTVITAKCFPRQIHSIKPMIASKWRDEIAEVGLICLYSVNGDQIGQIVKWDQRVRAANSKFPPSDDGHMTVIRRSTARPVVDVVVDVDVNREPDHPPDGGQVTVNGFESFWEAYPRKVGKGAALKIWKILRPTSELLESMLDALTWQKRTAQWSKERGQFIPHPRTWLHQRRWEDDGPERKEADEYREERRLLGMDSEVSNQADSRARGKVEDERGSQSPDAASTDERGHAAGVHTGTSSRKAAGNP